MKKILFSAIMIILLAGSITAGTVAFFADTEISQNNTYAMGTIEISVNSEMHWTGNFVWDDIKPGKEQDFELVITNEGENPLKLWKIIKCLVPDENDIIEPEQEWYDQENGGNPKNDIQSVLLYELAVDDDVIIDRQSGIVMADIADNYLGLLNLDVSVDPSYTGPETNGSGILNPGGTVVVRENFIMPEEVGNWAQSDKLTFVVELEARQIDAPEPQSQLLILDNKDAGGTWARVLDDRIALLKYGYQSPEFEYDLRATGLEPLTDYCFVYAKEPWNNDKILIYSDQSLADGTLDAIGSMALGDLPHSDDDNYLAGAKLWLVECGDYNEGTEKISNWGGQANWLFESWPGFINYREGGELSADLNCEDYADNEDGGSTDGGNGGNEPGGAEQEICGDGIDNDEDTYIDGDDTDCAENFVALSDLSSNSQFGPYHDYSEAEAFLLYNDGDGLGGRMVGRNLKPYATYQLKFEGKPACMGEYAATGNDAVNETVGLNGRWWNISTNSNLNGSPANNDDYYYDYSVSYNDAGDLGDNTECIQGYLIWDFATADENGDFSKDVAMDNSYHVLFCSGGTCGLTNNDYLVESGDSGFVGFPTCGPDDVNGQIERASCGTASLPSGNYNLNFVLVEESFHQGTWASVMGGDISFEIE